MKFKLTSVLFLSLTLCSAAFTVASEHWAKPPPQAVKSPGVSVEKTYQLKCSRCHAISRADSAVKNAREWETTVTRMRRKDPAWISADQAMNIQSWLAGRGLHQAKCGECHKLSRSDKKMTVFQWKDTVERMHGKKPGWMTWQERDMIIFYLTDINLLEPEKP